MGRGGRCGAGVESEVVHDVNQPASTLAYLFALGRHCFGEADPSRGPWVDTPHDAATASVREHDTRTNEPPGNGYLIRCGERVPLQPAFELLNGRAMAKWSGAV